MAKTNSNSITSILVSELNKKDSSFRNSILASLRQKISFYIKNKNTNDKNKYENISIKKNIKFYNGTHNKLQYKEMNEKEIDILARNPGEHKPQVMIEVKSSIGETLQDSQKKNGEYAKTANNRGIPLMFIIPKDYKDEDELPPDSIRIYWDEIKEKSDKSKNKEFSQQIANFVELSAQDKIFKKQIKNVDDFLKELNGLLENQKIIKKKTAQNNQWGIGYYYSTKKGDFFIGFSPEDPESFKNYSFTLCIAENCRNTYLGDNRNPPLLYNEGWYYFPILDKKLADGDEKYINKKLFNNVKENLKEEIINTILESLNSNKQ